VNSINKPRFKLREKANMSNKCEYMRLLHLGESVWYTCSGYLSVVVIRQSKLYWSSDFSTPRFGNIVYLPSDPFYLKVLGPQYGCPTRRQEIPTQNRISISVRCIATEVDPCHVWFDPVVYVSDIHPTRDDRYSK
jgi:hypothetical protein